MDVTQQRQHDALPHMLLRGATSRGRLLLCDDAPRHAAGQSLKRGWSCMRRCLLMMLCFYYFASAPPPLLRLYFARLYAMRRAG